MARRMSGSSARRTRSVRDDRFRRRRKPNHDLLPHWHAAAYSASVHNWMLSAAGYGVRSGALPFPRFPALSVSLEGAGTGKILIVRHAVVPSSDRIRDEIGLQNGCFPTARLAQPRAAKLCWFAAVCLHQYCERNDVGFVRRPLLDWSSDDLNFVL